MVVTEQRFVVKFAVYCLFVASEEFALRARISHHVYFGVLSANNRVLAWLPIRSLFFAKVFTTKFIHSVYYTAM